MGLSMLLPWGSSYIDPERELVDLCGSFVHCTYKSKQSLKTPKRKELIYH